MRRLDQGCGLSFFAVAVVLLSGCASKGGMTQFDPPALQLENPAPASAEPSVLQYAGDPTASGAAEFATATDSQGNTLFEEALKPDKEVTVTVPADGKLILSTRWTEGRTKQELNVLELDPSLKPGQNITLSLSESTKRYSIMIPQLSRIPVLGQMLLNPDMAGAAARKPELVIIMDGGGRTLYRGPATKTIDLDATDGELVVSTDWSDGTRTRDEISYQDRDVYADDWDDYVLVSRDDSGRYALNPSSNAQRGQILVEAVILEAGKGRFRDQPPTIGVVTGVDAPLLQGTDDMDTQALNLGVTLSRWGVFVPKLELGTVWGDDTTRREATGINSGWAFQAELSPGNSTGIASAAGTESSLESKYRSLKVSLTLSQQFKDEDDSDAMLDYNFSLLRTLRNYDGTIRLLAFPDVSSDDRLDISEYNLTAGIGVRGRHTFHNNWMLAGGLRLDAVYYRGEYEGDHHYLCDVCAVSDQDFTQTTSDSNNGLTWAAGAMGRIGYRVDKQSELYLGIDYRIQDKTPVLVTRTRPTDDAPHLITDDTGLYNIYLGFKRRL